MTQENPHPSVSGRGLRFTFHTWSTSLHQASLSAHLRFPQLVAVRFKSLPSSNRLHLLVLLSLPIISALFKYLGRHLHLLSHPQLLQKRLMFSFIHLLAPVQLVFYNIDSSILISSYFLFVHLVYPVL